MMTRSSCSHVIRNAAAVINPAKVSMSHQVSHSFISFLIRAITYSRLVCSCREGQRRTAALSRGHGRQCIPPEEAGSMQVREFVRSELLLITYLFFILPFLSGPWVFSAELGLATFSW